MNLFKKPFPQDLKTKVIVTAVFFGFCMGAFTLLRALLYFGYPSVFGSLTGTELAGAFLNGLRFDVAMTCLFLAPGIFLLFWPVKTAAWAKFCAALAVIGCAVVVGVLGADWAYFPETKRHLGDELLTAGTETGFLLHYAWAQCKPQLLTVALSFGGLMGWAWWFIGRHYAPKPMSLFKNTLLILLVGALLFIGFRGRVTGKILEMRDIPSFTPNITQSTLMLNGAFTAFHTLSSSRPHQLNLLDTPSAFSSAQKALLSSGEFIPDEQYPLMRQITKPKPLASKPLNVVVVLLESWTPKYIDVFNQGGYGVTPHFDQMAQKGIVFTQAYATGLRSIYGLSAAMAGVALVPGLPSFTQGLEMNAVTSLAKELKQRGYYTAFVQSSLCDSYQMCSIAKNIFGTDESYGMEHIPLTLPYQEEQEFGYDYETLQFSADKAAQSHAQKKPFFLFTFTGSTHVPFAKTIPQFQKYTRQKGLDLYLNSLYYADYAVGELLRRAQQDGWLEDTLFVFMADHSLGVAFDSDKLEDKARIPFVLYAPKYLKPQRVEYTVSQLDLIPTLYHMLGISSAFTALGKNALDPQTAHFAFVTEGTNIALLQRGQYTRHDRIHPLDSSLPLGNKQQTEMQQTLLSLDKSVTALFSNNHWFKPAQPFQK